MNVVLDFICMGPVDLPGARRTSNFKSQGCGVRIPQLAKKFILYFVAFDALLAGY